MKRVLKWLETKFSRHSAVVEADEHHTPVGVRVRPVENAKEEYSVEVALDAEVPDRVESHEPEENVLILDKYTDDTITQRTLGILDESSLDPSESTGFDPYNSGSFDKSKGWKSRSRK